MDDYAHAMQAYTQSQVLALVGLCENHGTSDRDSDCAPTIGVLHQGTGLTKTAETEEAGRQAANDAECTQA
jgi:hypothetical protein